LVIPSKALKAWRGAAALLYANIPTPFPIAYLERKKRRITKQGFYMSEWIDAAEEIRSLFHDLPDPLLTVLIQELAIQIRNWHDKGILHRDLSDGNILVKKNKSGRPQFYLTDTNRIRVKKRIRPFKRVKNLIRLGVPSRFQKKFLALYTDKPEGRGLLWMWYCLNKRTFIFYIQLKKYLRLKKIVRMLRLQ
jgi:serine/threonine protein kinase